MSTPILSTKLFVPRLRSRTIPRPRLIERLNDGLHGKLTLISASAGFGKTTLVCEWLAGCDRRVAWLSLDDGDNDPTRFLSYLIAALQSIEATIGSEVSGTLQSPQPPPVDLILTTLLNEIATFKENFVLVLDDYHVINTIEIDAALTFLLEHLPPQIHLVITTREDPQLPLARLRAQGQLNELRTADLRFDPLEAAAFLNQSMSLSLSDEEISALESRTEGWIVGLQLAAISMQGQDDVTGFIKSFTGSHRFVLDYLVEEVLEQQPKSVQTFLLRTSILDRLCGPLCDAVLDSVDSSEETLSYLEHANLFIVPLDNERCWYRYHHLFSDLLRHRLLRRMTSEPTEEGKGVSELHVRASIWYEENGFEIEAFGHAASANDVARAARLMKGEGMPLHFRGAMTSVLNWLESLPESVLNETPSLLVTYASVLTMAGRQINSIDEKLRTAEAALQDTESDDMSRDIVGNIAAIRAMLAVPQSRVETIISESRRALDNLHPDNLPVRTTATWTLGYAHQIQGDRAAARRAYSDAISISQTSGNLLIALAATTCLGQLQEVDNQLNLAAAAYRRALQLVGDPPWPTTCEAHLGLARVLYQWNDLDSAHNHARQCAHLASQLENVDTPVACGVFLARLNLALGDVDSAVTALTNAGQIAQHHFVHWITKVTEMHVFVLIRQGNLTAAEDLARTHDLPVSRARVALAQGDSSKALTLLEPFRRHVEEKDRPDELLEVMLLQALAEHAKGEEARAIRYLNEALTLAEPGGFVRIFVDEGAPMAALMGEAAKHAIAPDYIHQLQAAFGTVENNNTYYQDLDEPLSSRELEVLRLLATELNGPEIARELLVSLNTMRTHTKNIYTKLGVTNRRAAVRRAEELELL